MKSPLKRRHWRLCLDNFIRLDYEFDVDKLKQEMYNVAELCGWGDKNQICLTHPPGKPDWFAGTGPMIQNKTFTELNSFFTDTYFEKVYNDINNKYPLGRVRLMLLPGQKCFSLHADMTKRIHLPLITNEQCLMIIDDEVKHLPADGGVWLTNTTRIHTALNGNYNFNRLHILFDLL